LITQAVDQKVFPVKQKSHSLNSDKARDIIQSHEVAINKKYGIPKPSSRPSPLEMRRR
jgi:hypothetical protein